ncbi:hypothetical protein E6Q11_06555 [Candidatus Dojkabacteria bacterium]|uniref:Glutathione synthetase n=1 Tax=Candidatus Dojkabacteria bacterium TaxID=2099670 RepID=A0A5C7J2T1_9BACT|nr:MAG: hypothetical protein E6Q11_06555 [Candidatus Dojkabacteria bacterium]
MENILGIVASLITTALFMPQAFSVYQNKHNPAALEGVSIITSWLAITSGVLWVFYAMLTGAIWIAVPSFVSVPLSLFIVTVLYKTRNKKVVAPD